MAVSAQTIEDTFPIPSYRYTVDLGGEQFFCQDVTIGDFGVDSIIYYNGSEIIRMPGRQVDQIDVTMVRGVVKSNSQFYDWIKDIQLNRIDKRDMTVSLTDDQGQNPLVSWNVQNCFPTTLTVPDFSGSGNDISIETINMIADQVTITWG